MRESKVNMIDWTKKKKENVNSILMEKEENKKQRLISEFYFYYIQLLIFLFGPKSGDFSEGILMSNRRVFLFVFG